MTNRIIAVLATIIFFSLTSCSKEDPVERGPEIGMIDNESLYLYDMIPVGKYESFSRKDVSFRKSRLRLYMKNEMYTREGYSRGLHKSESVRKKLLEIIDKNMANVVYRKVVLEKYSNEKTLRILYERLQKRVSARHILISHKDAERSAKKTDRSKNEARELIVEIKSKINSRTDFIKYANDISEDPTSVNGGDLGFFKWGKMEDAFQETAFSLEPNTLSSPVETSYGFHIIWVDSIKNISQRPFEQMQVELKNKIFSIYRSEINLTAEKFLDSLNVVAETKFHDAIFDSLIKKITSFIASQKKRPGTQSPINFLKSVELPGPLVTYIDNGNEKSIYTEPLVSLLQDRSLSWSIAKYIDIDILKNIFRDETNNSLIKQFGFLSKYDRDEDVLEDLKKKEQSFMRQEITKIEVANKVIPEENNLLRYYNEHKDRYVSLGTSDIIEILVTEKSVADSLYLLVSNGQDISALASSYSERANTDKTGGVLRNITRNKFSPIGKIAATMKVGEITKPVKAGAKWSLFKLISKSPSGYKSFANVRSRVSADFKRDEAKRLRAVFEDYLNDKYRPEYYFENYIPELALGKVE